MNVFNSLTERTFRFFEVSPQVQIWTQMVDNVFMFENNAR